MLESVVICRILGDLSFHQHGTNVLRQDMFKQVDAKAKGTFRDCLKRLSVLPVMGPCQACSKQEDFQSFSWQFQKDAQPSSSRMFAHCTRDSSPIEDIYALGKQCHTSIHPGPNS